MKRLACSDHTNFRIALWTGSIICVLFAGTALATGFTLVGQSVQVQAKKDREFELSKHTKIREIEKKGEIAKAYEKAKIGQPTQYYQFISGTQTNVLDLASSRAQQLIDSKPEDDNLILIDKYRNVLGHFDGKQACNIKNDCRQIIK